MLELVLCSLKIYTVYKYIKRIIFTKTKSIYKQAWLKAI